MTTSRALVGSVMFLVISVGCERASPPGPAPDLAIEQARPEQPVADSRAVEPREPRSTAKPSAARPTKAAVKKAPRKRRALDVSKLYWAEARDGEELVIDAIDYKVRSKRAHEKLWEQLDDQCANGIDKKLPPNSAGIPRDFRIGQKANVLTRVGLFRRRIKSLGLCAGASEGHFLGVLGKTRHEELAGLVLLDTEPAGDTRLRAPTSVSVRSEPGAKILAAVRKHWAPSIQPDQVQITDGSFPGGRRWLVSVSITRRGQVLRTGLAFADEAGNLEPLEPFVERDDTYTVQHLVDVDGDGLDEIVYDADYYEGRFTFLIYWNKDRPKTHRLTGDGA